LRPTFVIDAGIPFGAEAFSGLGRVVRLPSPEIGPAALREADGLVVRTVTRVDARLLAGSRVSFVGTATIGFDHVDRDLLASRGIAFASAPGCNAVAVAEYVVAALLEVATREGRPLAGRTLGLIGVGHVGRQVAERAPALGLRVLRHDPPRARAEGAAGFVSLAELLARSELVSLHVPLTRDGRDPTWRLVDGDFLDRLPRSAWLLNTSRGEVVDEEALLARLRGGLLGGAVLDVWAGEPQISPALVAAAAIATPHVAGYSLEGKVAATRQVHEAARVHFGGAPWDPTSLLPPPPPPPPGLPEGPPEQQLATLTTELVPLARDDRLLRLLTAGPAADISSGFRKLRDEYPIRREFASRRIQVGPGQDDLARRLAVLGFSTG